MSTKMRQVSREDFEILTKYHPGEIRYYVDVDKALPCRRNPTRVSVQSKPVAPKKTAKKAVKRAINGTGKGINLPLVYKGTSEPVFGEKSLKGRKIERAVNQLFYSDPTKIVGKVDLNNKVAAMTTLPLSSVRPTISFLIKRGLLAHK